MTRAASRTSTAGAHEVDRQELPGALRGLAARLWLLAAAARAEAALHGGADSMELRSQLALSEQLEGVARRLDEVAPALCERCRRIEVVELFAIERVLRSPRP